MSNVAEHRGRRVRAERSEPRSAAADLPRAEPTPPRSDCESSDVNRERKDLDCGGFDNRIECLDLQLLGVRSILD